MGIDANTIYLNHEIIAGEKSWPLIRSTIGRSEDKTLAISQYNLVEAAGGSCQSQTVRRMEFIDSLRPVWVRDRRDIQREEVRNFVWERCFNSPMNCVCPFSRSLSAVLAYHLGAKTPLDCSARKWLAIFGGELQLDEPKTATVNALTILQAIDRQKKMSTQAQAFCEWVCQNLPFRDPRNRLIGAAECRELSEHCLDNQLEFFQRCRSMAVEDKLTDIRTHDPRRQPKRQDSIDLQHIVVALSYCRSFVTKDRYLLHCATQLTKVLRDANLASVFRSDL